MINKTVVCDLSHLWHIIFFGITIGALWSAIQKDKEELLWFYSIQFKRVGFPLWIDTTSQQSVLRHITFPSILNNPRLSVSMVNRQMDPLILIDLFVSHSNVRLSFDPGPYSLLIIGSVFPLFSSNDADDHENTSPSQQHVYWRDHYLLLAPLLFVCWAHICPE